MVQKIKSLLLNPFVSLLLAVLIGFLFYKLSIENIEISYSVSKTDELFSHKLNGEQIKLVDKKGNFITDTVYQKRVVLWNSGNKYIEKTDFFKTKPLVISAIGEARLIDSKIIRSSRESLDMSLEKSQTGSVEVKLGDDALEVGDGIVVSLLYTGMKEPEVTLTGRIRGISNDFNKVKWVYLNTANIFSKPSSLLLVLSAVFGGIILIINSLCLLDNHPKLKIVTNFGFGLPCGLFLFINFINLSYSALVGSFYSIGWL